MKNLEHIQDIGSMDEVFDILQPISTTNDYGEETTEYQLEAQLFGAFDFRKSGSETLDTDQITTHHTAELTIRYFPTLAEKWRVVRRIDMTDWNIDRITDAGKQRYQTLTLTKSN